MRIITSIRSMQNIILNLRHNNKKIGFVPTMGFFHQGHISLMRASVKNNDITVVSLFVNPMQFAPKEDLSRYPRDLKRDIRMAKDAGVDFMFTPCAHKMYPNSFLSCVDVEGITEVLCGASRPGHFKGVATIVSKLLNIVQPHSMYLGQKDAQQVEVIKRLVRDLNFNVKIHICPTLRAADGLALSSRNIYLSPSEMMVAPRLYQSLLTVRRMISDGERSPSKLISKIKKLISDGTGASIEYVACVSLDDFTPAHRIKGKILLAAAIKIGSTRLIDNVVVKV